MMRPSGILVLITGVVCQLPWQKALAGSPPHIPPQPWRAEAVVQGRDEAYDAERFLHELTFAHQAEAPPSAVENGIRGGTGGGSVSSDELYYDFRFRQDFGFREGGRNGFLLDIQRSGDLDGAYDRQLVGFRQNLGERSELWLQGDVFSDKAQSDAYFSGRHYLNGRKGSNETSWLHASWIIPDAYFNDKTSTPPDRFTREPPQSLFLQWHQQTELRQSTTISINWSPESEFVSRQENLTVASDNVRAAFDHRQQSGPPWALSIAIGGGTEPSPIPAARPARGSAPGLFPRLPESNDVSPAERASVKTPPVRLGLHPAGRARLFFGRAIDDTGDIRRREPVVFADITLQASAATTLSPALYLARPISGSLSTQRGRTTTAVHGQTGPAPPAIPALRHGSRKPHPESYVLPAQSSLWRWQPAVSLANVIQAGRSRPDSSTSAASRVG